MTQRKLPARLYICPEPGCGYQTELRWVLKNHLQRVHGYGKRESVRVSAENEYWANPHYYRVIDEEDESEDDD